MRFTSWWDLPHDGIPRCVLFHGQNACEVVILSVKLDEFVQRKGIVRWLSCPLSLTNSCKGKEYFPFSISGIYMWIINDELCTARRAYGVLKRA